MLRAEINVLTPSSQICTLRGAVGAQRTANTRWEKGSHSRSSCGDDQVSTPASCRCRPAKGPASAGGLGTSRARSARFPSAGPETMSSWVL